MREFTARKPRGEAEVLHSGAAKTAAPPVEKIAVEIKTAADESAAVRAGHHLAGASPGKLLGTGDAVSDYETCRALSGEARLS